MSNRKPIVSVELYAHWPKYRSNLLRVEARCFGSRSDDEADLEKKVREALFLAVIRDRDTAFGYCLVERKWPDTAYIASTAIDPEYQGQGHLKTLIDAVEAELVKVGYLYVHRDARVDNGYADKIAKHYGDRVVASFDHASVLGPLRFFRIRLGGEADEGLRRPRDRAPGRREPRHTGDRPTGGREGRQSDPPSDQPTAPQDAPKPSGHGA